jgi:hypothetical protein
MGNVTELRLLSAIECRARPYPSMSICAVLPSCLPGGARSAEASSAACQVLSDYAMDAESNWNTKNHRGVVHFEQLFDRRVEGNR